MDAQQTLKPNELLFQLRLVTKTTIPSLISAQTLKIFHSYLLPFAREILYRHDRPIRDSFEAI